jgi:hypothetical protein
MDEVASGRENLSPKPSAGGSVVAGPWRFGALGGSFLYDPTGFIPLCHQIESASDRRMLGGRLLIRPN